LSELYEDKLRYVAGPQHLKLISFNGVYSAQGQEADSNTDEILALITPPLLDIGDRCKPHITHHCLTSINDITAAGGK